MKAAHKALQPTFTSGGDGTGNGSEPPESGATPLADYADQHYAKLADKPNLQRLYKTSLRWFLSYCQSLTDVTLVEDVTKEVIDDFIITMIKGQNLKLTTVSQYCNMLRQMFAQAVDEKLIQSNPVGNTVTFLQKEGAASRQSRPSKKTYKTLYSQMQPETREELRTLTILGIMLDTGLPASQVLTAQIAVEDTAHQRLPAISPDGFFDFQRHGKRDMCPLSDLTLKYYHQWLAARANIPRHNRLTAIFIGRTGRSIAAHLFSKQLAALCNKTTANTKSSPLYKTQSSPVRIDVRPRPLNNDKATH